MRPMTIVLPVKARIYTLMRLLKRVSERRQTMELMEPSQVSARLTIPISAPYLVEGGLHGDGRMPELPAIVAIRELDD